MALNFNYTRWIIFSSEGNCVLGVGHMRKYCLNCGKKFYAKTWTGYPQTEYSYDSQTDRHERCTVPDEHKHFHSQSCMKEWLAKNHEAFTLLLTSMGNNDRNIETNNHN